MSLEEILLVMLSKMGGRDFLAWASHLLQVEATRQASASTDKSLDSCLQRYGREHDWKEHVRKVVKGSEPGSRLPMRGKVWRAVSRLAAMFREVGVPLGIFQGVPAPWSDWLPGSKVVVMFGAQELDPVTVAGVKRASVKHQFNSLDDARAWAELQKVLRGLGLQFRVELVPVPAGLQRDDVESSLAGYRDDPAVGAIVIIGSPVVNAAADRAAELATGGRKSIAKFRFLHGVAKYAPCLCESAVTSEDQGIRIHGCTERDFIAHAKEERRRTWEDRKVSVRQSKDEIAAALATGKRDGFRDCGVIIIDNSQRCLLILAMGNGGEASVVAVSALADTLHFARQLSEDDFMGKDRAFEIVDVELGLPHGSVADVRNLKVTRFELPNREDDEYEELKSDS